MPRRGSTQERGYGYNHQLIRRRWQERIDSGEEVRCWRCGRLIVPGMAWDLGHDDNDRGVYRGPECVHGNRKAGGAKGGRVVQAKRRRQSGNSQQW